MIAGVDTAAPITSAGIGALQQVRGQNDAADRAMVVRREAEKHSGGSNLGVTVVNPRDVRLWFMQLDGPDNTSMESLWSRVRPPAGSPRSQGWLGFFGFLGFAGLDTPLAYLFFAFFAYFRFFLPPRREVPSDHH